MKDLNVFEKPLKNGWTLRKLAHAEIGAPPGKGCYWDEHELEHQTIGVTLKYPQWEWAEWDRNRLVWATDGCLYTGALEKQDLKKVRLLYNFNDLRFEPLCAPY